MPIAVATPADPVDHAERLDIDMIGLGANTIDLSDDLGRVFRSLRLRDATDETSEARR